MFVSRVGFDRSAALPSIFDRRCAMARRVAAQAMLVVCMAICAACITLILAGIINAATAHELRPAYLDMRETGPGEFRVLWKTPMRGDARLALHPEFSGATTSTPIATRLAAAAAIQTWTLRSTALRGQTLRIGGLDGTMTDALVRIEFADGTSWTQRLTAREPAEMIPPSVTGWSVSTVYFALGVEHILEGLDHLLFVLALLIITRGGWGLVRAVTAFTVAHSITLALATLDFVHVPSRPIEVAIALSILFLAVEIVHGLRGQGSLTSRVPWAIAFAFGLLHGFGFAGALSEAGMPERHIPAALLFFNLGVEAGQLAFVGAVLGIMLVWQRIDLAMPPWVRMLVPYGIGCVSAFWVIQRIAV